MIELGERLGFDSAWLRHRHLRYGISCPVAVLAAASQRTGRIEFGTAVTPQGWEKPLRLAEDLSTVDVLSGGRLHPGVSGGPPMHFADVRDSLYPDTAEAEDFSYERVRRLVRLVRGHPASGFSGAEGIERYSDRIQPHAPGLADRIWYGPASLNSARWARSCSRYRSASPPTTSRSSPTSRRSSVRRWAGRRPRARPGTVARSRDGGAGPARWSPDVGVAGAAEEAAVGLSPDGDRLILEAPTGPGVRCPDGRRSGADPADRPHDCHG